MRQQCPGKKSANIEVAVLQGPQADTVVTFQVPYQPIEGQPEGPAKQNLHVLAVPGKDILLLGPSGIFCTQNFVQSNTVVVVSYNGVIYYPATGIRRFPFPFSFPYFPIGVPWH